MWAFLAGASEDRRVGRPQLTIPFHILQRAPYYCTFFLHCAPCLSAKVPRRCGPHAILVQSACELWLFGQTPSLSAGTISCTVGSRWRFCNLNSQPKLSEAMSLTLHCFFLKKKPRKIFRPPPPPQKKRDSSKCRKPCLCRRGWKGPSWTHREGRPCSVALVSRYKYFARMGMVFSPLSGKDPWRNSLSSSVTVFIVHDPLFFGARLYFVTTGLQLYYRMLCIVVSSFIVR